MARLAVRDVVMEFPAVRALDEVSLEFASGEVHGIIGENGAGKSTLMRILAGLQEPTLGEILFDGQPVRFRSVDDALNAGIAMIHQELNLVDTLTVAENVFLGRERTRYGLVDRRRQEAEAREALERVGAPFSPGRFLGELSLAQKQLVEIAKALAYRASVLIMDEPTAVLSEAETRRLFALIEELREGGVTVLYISHRLAEVERVCDRVSVLRDGRHVGTFPGSDLTQAEMARLMVGRDLDQLYPERPAVPDAPPTFTAEGLSDGHVVRDVTLQIRPGEIVGLAGLVGAGRTELAETIVGLRPAVAGRIERDGRRVRIRSPREAARRGIAYVSEDRKDAGLLLDLDTVRNLTLPNLGAYARPVLRPRLEEERARHWKERMGIRVGDLRAPTLHLSGGNQQKVAIAKWLDLAPEVLILDEPTRGVDIGAKRELYNLIAQLAREGRACLVISSELPELLGLCHRILVMREGRIVGELPAESATEERIMVLAAGVEAA
jgi:ribose transport system ATP-binding protein